MCIIHVMWKKKQREKKYNPTMMFIKTFLVSFLVIMVVLTPTFAAINKVTEVLESNPGGEDVPVLEEELDYLISPDNPFYDAFTTAKRVNVLLLGADHNNLTDTIVLASFDMNLKHLDLISIPRDTYYYRGPGYNDPAHHKINAVYRKDPVNTARAVSEILMDMPINYYILFDYEGVAAIVNSMDGVPMNIAKPMKYSDPLDTPPLYIDIPAGEQVLYGEHAVQFLRYRSGYPDADLGRIKAQQEFMKNAFKRSLSFDLPKIAQTVFEYIQSDMKLKTVLYLATKAIGISGEDITTYTLPNKYEGVYVRTDVQGVSDMLTEIYSMAPEPDETDEADPPESQPSA